MRELIRQLFSGLRLRLLLLVLLACAPLMALMLYSAWEDRRRQEADWKQLSQELISLAHREEEKVVGQTRQLLFAMAESSQIRSGNKRDCKKMLDGIFTTYSRYANLGVIRTNETILVSALPWPEPVLPAERRFFRRALESRGFSIGDVPTETAGGRLTVNFGCPVFDATGQVQSVVFAALDLGWFNRFESELAAQLPKGASWTAIDRTGGVLARHPGGEKWVGQTFPEQELVKQVSADPSGVIEATAADGIHSFYAYASMPSQLVAGKVVAFLGIPRHLLFAEADRKLRRNLAGLGLAAGLAFIFAWVGSSVLVLREVRALVSSSARLASGDLSARTGLPPRGDEFGQLTRSFDQMAQAVEQRELETRRARDKMQVLSRRLVEAQETERRRIALELHDEIGQSLTVAELNLQALLRSPSSSGQPARLKESLQVIERVLEQVRNLALNLRPSMLDDLGLESALIWLVKRQGELAGLWTEIHVDPLGRRLDPSIETECFRVAQEALTNVIRHAKARSVMLELRQDHGRLKLCVRDDGIGFDTAAIRGQAVRGASLGLLSMEERAALSGGGVEFISSIGRGTEVHAWFPLKWRTPGVESKDMKELK